MKPMTNLIGSHQTDADRSRWRGDSKRVVRPREAIPITPGSLLLEELALDSLDLVAVILQIQDRFQVEIDPDEIPDLRCVDDLLYQRDEPTSGRR